MSKGPLDKDEFASTLDLSNLTDSGRPDATLEPTMAPRIRREKRRESLHDAKQALAKLEESGNTIRIVSPIAEGGMGRIFLAEQGGLRRSVAAKTLKDDFLEKDFADRLTREARVTGLVEHPNIVPVYTLQRDERGAPLMVMRRIEGVSFRSLIRDADHTKLEDERDTTLESHLRILMSVCDALSYAHSRGILHLDVKPDNIMVGAFRDVYLVDWGVACSTREEHRGFLPMVDETTEILGTPAYLAPEVVDPNLARIGPHTDVFLLGATLFEALAKVPPYRGESVRDMLYEAYLARPPVLPDFVPEELATIVRRAMNHTPGERYASPDAFRLALETFLRHRSSARLADSSLARLRELDDSLANASELEPVEAARVLRRASECRFGFAQALREWPTNPGANEGMVKATIAIASFHLARGEHASAESALDELEAGDREHDLALFRLRDEIRRGRNTMSRLREIGEHHDDAQSRVARAYFVLAMVCLLAFPVVVAFGLERVGIYVWEPWHSIAYIATLLAVGLSTAVLMRRKLMPNRVSRRIVVTFGFIATAILLRKLLASFLGHGGIEDVSMDIFLFGVGMAVIGLLTDRRFFGVAVTSIVGGFLIALFPAHTMLLLAITGVVGPVSTALMWLLGARRS